ncbi:hypothetical protein [Methylocystis sp. H62]|uniref:hypothetical protein n=1 Tax=Methylocystis sp. H62 TaxID=2785789 RepID=UPI003917142F
MIRFVGSRPSVQAVNATLTVIDFIDRGGTLMMSRLFLPAATCESRQQIWSMCQL